jgi:hypothetical protein
MNSKNKLLFIFFLFSLFTHSVLGQANQPPRATEALKLEFISRFTVGGAGNSAEIVAYDGKTKRLFVINSTADRLEILDFSNPSNIQRIRSVDMTVYGDGSQSVAVKNDVVAVAVDDRTPFGSNGRAVFFNTNGDFISQVEVGNLPDMITFSPDGRMVLTANEGEPNSYGQMTSVDPEGSISIIDITSGVNNLTQNNVTTLGFTQFNGQMAALRARGVRIYGVGATVAQDLEPEYITVSQDSRRAWVTLQENNAVAVIDLAARRITDILPLGLKDHSLPANSFDASDQGGVVNITTWPVKGMYQPDAIASYQVGGTTYLVTANEGDARDYTGLAEEVRVNNRSYVLDPTVFPNATTLKVDTNLGRLTVTNRTGDLDGDGDFDEIHVLGGRSFSIWNANTGALVYDSGNQMELITANHPIWSPLFNASNDNNNPKNRSDNKGPEPEGVVIFQSLDKVYAFIALERIGGVMVYDVTNPTNPIYVNYINSRTTAALGGDRGAEGIIFVPAEESPNGNDMVITANETSATIAVYGVQGINRTLFSPSITARAGSNKVTVSWQAVALADKYEVYMLGENTPLRLVGTTSSTTFEVGNLTNGVTYSFRVKAINNATGIESVFSNTVSAKPSIVLGVEEETSNNTFQVYPNPNNGSFSLKMTNLKGKNAQISVLDLNGRLLYQQNVLLNNTSLESSIELNIANGMYLLLLQTEENSYQRKLVIER